MGLWWVGGGMCGSGRLVVVDVEVDGVVGRT